MALEAVIFDIKRFAVHDGPGIRTTVFMKGCPLRCWWCHNPEGQAIDPITVEIERKVNGKNVRAVKKYGESMDVGHVLEIVRKDKHFYEESGGGVTFSGGEPLMQPEALMGMLSRSREEGIRTAVDTSGFAERKWIKRILGYTDLFLFDLKNMDPELHRKYTGVDNKLIFSNADFLLGEGANLIFRIPVVPGVNTNGKEVDGMIRFITERREGLKEVHLLPYHRIAENKYARMRMRHQLPHLEEPAEDFMEELRTRFERTGLRVTVGG